MKTHVRTLLMTAATAVLCFAASAQEPAGLVGWWQGENNLLDSKGANNAIVSPAAARPVDYAPGRDGQAWQFNGGKVIAPSSASLMPANLTIQVWVKGTALPPFRYMVWKAGGASGIQYALYTGDGTAKFFINGGAAMTDNLPTSPWDGNWHQLTAVYDGSAITLYMDGGASSVTAPAGAIDYANPGVLNIGDYTTPALPYTGMMDDLKIFNRALTAAEVLDTYTNPGSAAGTTGLVTWYKAEGNADDVFGLNDGEDGNSAPARFEFGEGKTGSAFFAKGLNAAVPDVPELRPATVTAQAWVKSVAPGLFRYIICKSRAVGGVSYALYTEDAGSACFFVSLEGVGTVKSPVASPQAIWDGAWHLATGTFDGSTVRLFLDGLEVGSGTPATAATIDYSDPKELVFADYRAGGGLPFYGFVDDIQIYDRALSAAEIQQYYTGKAKVVAWWRAANDANDTLGGNNGTLVGTASYGSGRTGHGGFVLGTAGSVQIPDAANLKPNTITVEAVVAATAPGANKYVLSKSNTGTDASYGLFTGPSGGLAFYVTTAGGRVVSPVADASMWDGLYHMVTGVYDGAKVRLYVDGKEIGSGTAATGNIAYGTYQSGKLIFGDFSETPGSAAFNGTIDQVRIYNAGLTAKQVADNAYQPVLMVDQPASGAISGPITTLRVYARGESPIHYQWMKDGVDLPGRTLAKLVLTNAEPGSYSVRISPGAPSFVAGKYGQAYDSRSLGIVRVPNDPAFNTNTAFTVQLWAKGSSVGAYKWIFTKARDVSWYSGSYGFLTDADGWLKWYVVLGGASLSEIGAKTNSQIWDGNWHQLTGTWDGTLATLYVDGNLQEIGDAMFGGDVSTTTNYLGGDIVIGDMAGVPGAYHFPGMVDEVKFFQRALTADEVAQSYASQTWSGAAGDLVSWWKFDGNFMDQTGRNDAYPVPQPGTLVSQAAVLTAQATPPSLSGAKVAGGNFQAAVTGAIGTSYVVYRTTDFVHWTPIETNAAPFTFTDPLGAGGKFYRAATQ